MHNIDVLMYNSPAQTNGRCHFLENTFKVDTLNFNPISD